MQISQIVSASDIAARHFLLMEARRIDAETSPIHDHSLQDILAEIKEQHGIGVESQSESEA